MVPFIMAGMAAINMLQQGQKARHEAEMQQIVNDTNAYVANNLRESGNELAAAQGHLARFSQSLRNRERNRVAGQAINAVSKNITRVADNFSERRLDRRIQNAEEMGALAVRAGATGTFGGTQQMLAATINLRNSRIAAAEKVQFDDTVSNLQQQRADITSAMILGLEDVNVVDNLNYMPTLSQEVPKPSSSAIMGQALVAGAQAYFGAGGGNPFASAATPIIQFAAPINGTPGHAIDGAGGRPFALA